MIELPLRLRHSGARASAAAWLIPGDDPEAWIEEIALWDVPMAGVALYVLPGAHGVLAIPPEPPRETMRALPYARLGGALYVPAEARVDPPISDEEASHVADGRVLVLHPAAGLVAFREEEVPLRPGGLGGQALRVSALLAPPPRTERAWDRADPGIATSPRLLSVEPETTPSVDMILREARGDIGSASPDQIPAAPDEPKRNPAAQAGGWLKRQLGKARQWMGGKGSRAPSPPPDLDDKRAREIQRLMGLLSANPDEGLRYALPLRDIGARGVAAPSSHLSPRDVNFDLNRLRGGRAGDSWSVPADVLASLRARYRDLANREIRQGRYRRAAYIFAELLGDHAAAAATLAQGKHFREAAVLYRDHLKQPLAAARCLEEGGLFAEAIAIYEAEGQHLTAGDLYARIDRPEEAAQAYRRAAEKLKQEGNLLAAARVLETKVQANDEALALLASAWPWSDQAVQCLGARFELLGRLGRHEESGRLVVALRQASAPTVRSSDLVRGLAEVSARYPDRGVRSRAADAARVVAGQRLPRADLQETGALVQDVSRLAPEDRLLQRDAQRFHARRRDLLSARRLPGARKEAPEQVGGFQLARDVTWRCAASHGNVFYAAGFSARGPVVVRGLWNGQMQRVDWKLPGHGRCPLALLPSLHQRDPMIAVLVGGPHLDLLKLAASDSIPVTTLVGTPHWMPEGARAVAYGVGRHAWVARQTDEGQVLAAYSAEGQLVSTHAVPAGAVEGSTMDDAPPPPLLACANAVFLGLGPHLLMMNPGQPVSVVDLGQWVLGLVPYMPTSHPRIAATCDTGGMVFWVGATWGRHRPIGEGLVRPVATFTQDGSLVILGEREGHVYDTRELKATLRQTFDAPAEPPLALVPAARSNEFAVFGRDGDVRILRLPKA